MIGFKHTYLSTQQIFEKVAYISSDNISWAFFLISTIFGSFIFILYFFPILSIIQKYLSKQKQKEQRKLMIRQIAMQREIEEEIEQEL